MHKSGLFKSPSPSQEQDDDEATNRRAQSGGGGVGPGLPTSRWNIDGDEMPRADVDVRWGLGRTHLVHVYNIPYNGKIWRAF